jgi:hypothetical protein
LKEKMEKVIQCAAWARRWYPCLGACCSLLSSLSNMCATHPQLQSSQLSLEHLFDPKSKETCHSSLAQLLPSPPLLCFSPLLPSFQTRMGMQTRKALLTKLHQAYLTLTHPCTWYKMRAGWSTFAGHALSPCYVANPNPS